MIDAIVDNYATREGRSREAPPYPDTPAGRIVTGRGVRTAEF